MSAQMLEVSLLGVGTVPRLERDAWSTNGQMTKARTTTGYAPPLAEEGDTIRRKRKSFM